MAKSGERQPAVQLPKQALIRRHVGLDGGSGERGLDESAVLGVERGVRLDRELSHRAHIVFVGDWDLERCVGGESSPVTWGRFHVLIVDEDEERVAFDVDVRAAL